LPPLTTPRLILLPGTPELARADLTGPEALSAALGTPVARGWPPEYYDAPAIEYSLRMMEQGNSEWNFYYISLRSSGRMVIGICGYKGPPSEDGSVEIGYSIVAEQQRRGFATEAAAALVDRAFESAAVSRVIAETLPGLVPSITVLERNGFRLLGQGSEPGVIRYQLTRSEFDAEYTQGDGGR
jgi:[ribosomal protein S5]-alanine N-acetyltransferase